MHERSGVTHCTAKTSTCYHPLHVYTHIINVHCMRASKINHNKQKKQQVSLPKKESHTVNTILLCKKRIMLFQTSNCFSNDYYKRQTTTLILQDMTNALNRNSPQNLSNTSCMLHYNPHAFNCSYATPLQETLN